MNKLLNLQQKIIPEMMELLDKRYQILKRIYYNQPIGRRALAQELNLGERIVRTEVNFLKIQGLVDINSIGMMVTKDGENILEELEDLIHEINGLSKIEKKLEKYLGISKAIVVPGDLEKDSTVLKEMGRIAALHVKNLIQDNSIIAVTGGSSVAQVVDNFPKINKQNLLVVPARGGIGRVIETQASTLAAKLAIKIGANHKLFHVPDNLSYEALEKMINEPEIKETISYISKADILIFGIGSAKEMAKRRGLREEQIEKLINNGAVSEAFGYYFGKNGEFVYKAPTIGLHFDDVKNIKHIIAIAGGKNKADAIISTKTQNPNMVLVADEGVAREIINIKESEGN
ncbi:central glycolytic genes regulator [Fervidicella metallireducens AeB]|uniref:Central glycolytic genes regulator n=1 Tax=Fervidicella metallireducens AeB TaxID=1403537 RepID=A0A017RWF2_9CLOT|nr:sugar-binding domain-containing protein [Fervidicella metallireducens]EYE89073.1 central glycolytic genes regulator [Fervidicella metallireducens AeB]